MPKGTGVSAGVGFAQVLVWQAAGQHKAQPQAGEPLNELQRFNKALQAITAKNEAMREKTARRFGDSEAAIFDAYHMMLNDEEGFVAPVRTMIAQDGQAAEAAVTKRLNALAAQFLELDSEYMRQRAEDIYSLRDQMLREMAGTVFTDASHLDAPTVVVAHALGPTDIANMDLSHLEGIVCETGGYSSHTAIIARTLGIPAVVGVYELLSQLQNGDTVALDGETGEVWINPDRKEIRYLRTRGEQLAKSRQEAQRYRGLPTITTDGHRIELATNAGQLEELAPAIENDAEAIGLYRTEVMHINRMPMAGEEEQYLTFRHILEKMGGKPVTIRLYDDGGNMPTLPIKGSTGETNPVLGYRGVRMCLGRRSFFTTQLRALLRASAYGELKALIPLVSSVEEVQQALEILEDTKLALRREQVPFDEHLPVGVLVETPAAALIAPQLAELADFLSIGINDLIQFTLAIDRNNTNLAYLYHPFHPPVLQLVKSVVDAAHAADKTCNLCGDTPGYLQILPVFLGMGVDGFSTNPGVILPTRRLLNRCCFVECYRMAQKVLQATTAGEVQAVISNHEALAIEPEESVIPFKASGTAG